MGVAKLVCRLRFRVRKSGEDAPRRLHPIERHTPLTRGYGVSPQSVFYESDFHLDLFKRSGFNCPYEP